MADNLPDFRSRKKAITRDAVLANLKQSRDLKHSIGGNHGIVEEILFNDL